MYPIDQQSLKNNLTLSMKKEPKCEEDWAVAQHGSSSLNIRELEVPQVLQGLKTSVDCRYNSACV